ncbi:hypothetical protein [Vibrio quintilis]|uniref:Uncharacterized protein n=1 Tax=Vibrio quintilis TaxID=1117707 RepID=A0A1M7YZB1_9VIBR|nr:hypothetical protein [Vibrio quintilis]SHO57913.1 hypothetical protein VQ7734_03683 [Vibrio quintilis]
MYANARKATKRKMDPDLSDFSGPSTTAKKMITAEDLQKGLEGVCTAPQSYFARQPATGIEKSYCAYYSYLNFHGKNTDKQEFAANCRVSVEKQLGMSFDDADWLAMVNSSGLSAEPYLMNQCGLKKYEPEAGGGGKTGWTELPSGIRRFMVATSLTGHWKTYIQASGGVWWRYDSLNQGPELIGGEAHLLDKLGGEKAQFLLYR